MHKYSNFFVILSSQPNRETRYQLKLRYFHKYPQTIHPIHRRAEFRGIISTQNSQSILQSTFSRIKVGDLVMTPQKLSSTAHSLFMIRIERFIKTLRTLQKLGGIFCAFNVFLLERTGQRLQSTPSFRPVFG